jgi:hypothetical protein
MVDVVGGLRIEVPDRIVADRGEVHDSVEAGEVLALDVANIGVQRLPLAPARAKCARGEEVGVEPDHLVAGVLEHGDEH